MLCSKYSARINRSAAERGVSAVGRLVSIVALSSATVAEEASDACLVLVWQDKKVTEKARNKKNVFMA